MQLLKQRLLFPRVKRYVRHDDTSLAHPHGNHLTVDNSAQPFMLDVGRKKPISKIRKIAVEQADRRMHKYFTIDKVGKDAWFEPIEELIGRPKFVCDRGGRRHKSSLIEMACGLKVNGKQAADYFSLGQDESAKKDIPSTRLDRPDRYRAPGPIGLPYRFR